MPINIYIYLYTFAFVNVIGEASLQQFASLNIQYIGYVVTIYFKNRCITLWVLRNDSVASRGRVILAYVYILSYL